MIQVRNQVSAHSDMGVSSERGTDWATRAACVTTPVRRLPKHLFDQYGHDLHFPVGYKGVANLAQVHDAKRVCHGCPVKAQCLEWALSREKDPGGVAGATTPDERKRLRRQRAGETHGVVAGQIWCCHDRESRGRTVRVVAVTAGTVSYEVLAPGNQMALIKDVHRQVSVDGLLKRYRLVEEDAA